MANTNNNAANNVFYTLLKYRELFDHILVDEQGNVYILEKQFSKHSDKRISIIKYLEGIKYNNGLGDTLEYDSTSIFSDEELVKVIKNIPKTKELEQLYSSKIRMSRKEFISYLFKERPNKKELKARLYDKLIENSKLTEPTDEFRKLEDDIIDFGLDNFNSRYVTKIEEQLEDSIEDIERMKLEATPEERTVYNRSLKPLNNLLKTGCRKFAFSKDEVKKFVDGSILDTIRPIYLIDTSYITVKNINGLTLTHYKLGEVMQAILEDVVFSTKGIVQGTEKIYNFTREYKPLINEDGEAYERDQIYDYANYILESDLLYSDSYPEYSKELIESHRELVRLQERNNRNLIKVNPKNIL